MGLFVKEDKQGNFFIKKQIKHNRSTDNDYLKAEYYYGKPFLVNYRQGFISICVEQSPVINPETTFSSFCNRYC